MKKASRQPISPAGAAAPRLPRRPAAPAVPVHGGGFPRVPDAPEPTPWPPKRSRMAPARERFADVGDATAEIHRQCPGCPRLAMVLGSSFAGVLDAVRADVVIPYERIPGFAAPTVAGHSGRFVVGDLEGTPVVLLAGRAHYYEGHSMATVTFPIRVLAALGVQTVLLTNAAGGINRRFRPGDFMVISDHINCMGVSPLRQDGPQENLSFVDLSETYPIALQRRLRRAARSAGARAHLGVYVAVAGPAYETPAEIRAFARLGADAVGMSTVPEAVMARALGLRVAGLSCITNPAAGLRPGTISHAEVLATGARTRAQATALLAAFVRDTAREVRRGLGRPRRPD